MPDPLNMASSGKKGKKSKGKTVPLNDFLQDTQGNTTIAPIRKSQLNWADEVEDSYDPYESRSSKAAPVVLPTAPKAARGLDDFTDKIPQSPPYIAYLSNLPYEVEEEDIADFFKNLKISNMRIPREDRAGEGTRVRGFGYVEFDDQESLIEALAKPTCILKGRRIRIEVATNSENDRRKGGRMDMNRDRGERPEVSTGDWRSGTRKEPESDRRPSYRDGGGGGGFSRDREGGGGFSRDREGGGGFSRDREGGGGFGRDRDRGEGISRDREVPDRPGAWRDATDRPAFKDNDRYERKDDRYARKDDRYERKEDSVITRDGMSRDKFEERRGFGPRRNDREERNGGFRRDEGGDKELRTRPKLNLVPRGSVPVESSPPEAKEGEAPPAPKPTPAPTASIFGAAKPVDTSARERQIEERLAKQTTEVDREGRKDDDKRRDDRMRRSPDRARRSPDRARRSPDRARRSPDRARRSPEMVRRSPDRGRRSPDHSKRSPDRARRSPDKLRRSPDRSRRSPEKGRRSPDIRRFSPRRSPDLEIRRRDPSDHTSPPRKRADDKRGPPPGKHDKDKKPREYTERDMPKLKTPEPVKIIATNQYAFLGEDTD